MKIVLLPVLFMSSLLSSCDKTVMDDLPGDPVSITIEAFQKDIISSANRIAFELFKPAVLEGKGAENIMISPFSITSALSMTLNGAREGTFDAMLKALGLESKALQEINETYLKLLTEMVPVDEHVAVEIANSVWIEKRLSVKKAFISTLRKWYKAEAFNIDVNDANAVNMVNGWIAGKTHDKITEMLDYLDPDLAMLLINAIYFNGKWRYQFDKENTKDEPFFVTPSAPENVPTMHIRENLKVADVDDATIAEIPYGRGNYTMIVVLPAENTTAEKITAGLTQEIWNSWLDLLGDNTTEVDLSIPRFKYKYKRNLNEDLINLGMGVAFTGAADFSNISEQDLMISRVLHETFIETTEEGTEAAAATVVEIRVTSMPVIREVRLDRPFLYFIREVSTGTILFAGKVGDPGSN